MATVHRSNRRSLYVRIFVPADLKPLLGKEEIWKSLGTSDQAVAELRSRVVEGKASALFLHLQQHGHSMTLTQIRFLVSRYIKERLDEWEESIASTHLNNEVNGQWQDHLSDFCQSDIEDYAKGLRENNLKALPSGVLKDFLQRYDLRDIEEGTQTHKLLCRELLKAESVLAGKIKGRVQGDYGTSYDDAAYPTSPAPTLSVVGLTAGFPPSTSVVTEPKHVFPLSDAIPAYLKHHEHRAPGTIEAKRNVLKRFLELGGDKPVHTITKQDCITYRDTLRKLPANASKKFPGMALKDVLKRAQGWSEKDLLSKQTVNQDLTHLTHFFSWLINEGRYSGSNPVEGLTYQGIEAKQTETFSDADIKTIFTSSEYTQQRKDGEDARYWLPLLLLLTGARREEIANLALAEIKEDEGVRYFDIVPDQMRGRRLKNKASRRRVPIHSHLIELGFLQYVETMKSRGESVLFPKHLALKKRGQGIGRQTAGDLVAKWFHRLLLKLNIPGEKSLHSFRPTMTTKLYEAGVDGETRRELLGHSGKDVHEAVYLRPPLAVLKQHLERINIRSMLGVRDTGGKS
jgi:integrase